MHFTNILTIAALASTAMAGFAPHSNGGSYVATGEKDAAKKPAHHCVRDAARERLEPAAHYEPKHEHHAHDAREHGEKGEAHPAEKGEARHHQGKIDRRNGGIYWCTKNNWKGTCKKVSVDNNCHKWTPGLQGSFGPDPGITCHFYEGEDCSGPSTSVKYPGSDAVYWFSGGKGVTYPPEAWKCHT